jgi:hypothetical protein
VVTLWIHVEDLLVHGITNFAFTSRLRIRDRIGGQASRDDAGDVCSVAETVDQRTVFRLFLFTAGDGARAGVVLAFFRKVAMQLFDAGVMDDASFLVFYRPEVCVIPVDPGIDDRPRDAGAGRRIRPERGIRFDRRHRPIHQRLDLEVGPQLVDDPQRRIRLRVVVVELEEHAPLLYVQPHPVEALRDLHRGPVLYELMPECFFAALEEGLGGFPQSAAKLDVQLDHVPARRVFVGGQPHLLTAFRIVQDRRHHAAANHVLQLLGL